MDRVSTAKVGLVLLFVFGGLHGSHAGGAVCFWSFNPALEGRWLDSGKWRDGAFPGIGDGAHISNGGTVLIEAGDTTPTANSLYLGYTDFLDPSELRITGSSATLTTASGGEVYVGYGAWYGSTGVVRVGCHILSPMDGENMQWGLDITEAFGRH